MGRREWLLLGGITLAGALIRFLTLGHQSFDHDEAVTATHVLHSGLGSTMHAVTEGERSPPLYYLLAWLWSKLFGTGEVGLRSLSALFGTVLIPVAFLAARRFASSTAGLIAAGLVAFNPYLIWYSQEARSYELFVLFSAIGLMFFAASVRDGDRRSVTLWAAASALAVCSHYFAAFLVAPQALWLLYARWRQKPAMIAVGCVLLVGLALIPYAKHQEGSGRKNHFTEKPLVQRAVEIPLKYAAGEEPGPLAGSRGVDAVQVGAALGSGLLFLLALGLTWSRGGQDERRGVGLYGGPALAAIAAPLLVATVGADFIDPRNLIGSLFPFLVVAAIGLSLAPRPSLKVAAGAAGCALFVAVNGAIYASAQMQRSDWRGAADAIGTAPYPRIVVVARNGKAGLIYYLNARELNKKAEPPDGVREIDVLSKVSEIEPPKRPFRLVRQQGLAPSFVLRVFRAPQPTYVLPNDLASRKVLTERSSVLLDPGS